MPITARQLADAIDEMAMHPKGGKMAAIAYRNCARLIRRKLMEPCPYCDGKFTGLPGNACENCMNTGLIERTEKPPLKLHFTNDWLRTRIASDPDVDVEAGDPTAIGDAVADEVRIWYEANRETWWERRRRRGDVADNFILGLINEVHRVEKAIASPIQGAGHG
jgi:hypothetical protein